MNYEKLDAELTAELEQAAEISKATELPVFIYLAHALGPAEIAFLKGLGVTGDFSDEIITANVSPRAIDELSEQPWVRYLKLSRSRRPLA